MATYAPPSSVTSSATAVQLAPANAYRKGLWIKNDSTSILYVAVGDTPSSSSYHLVLQAGEWYEWEQRLVPETVVNGVWSAANGSAKVTEIS